MCLRGSQKQSRAREQRWSHTYQRRITQPWWVDLGGEAIGERKCAFATTCSAMETNKVLHFVPSGKYIKALRTASQLCTTQHSLGEPWGSLPGETWEPVCETCSPPPLPLGRAADVWACFLFYCTLFCVCSFCVLRNVAASLFVNKNLFLFSLQERWGFLGGWGFVRICCFYYYDFFFFLFMSGMWHKRFLHCVPSVQGLNLEKQLKLNTRESQYHTCQAGTAGMQRKPLLKKTLFHVLHWRCSCLRAC